MTAQTAAEAPALALAPDQTGPIAPRDRVATLDVMRGLAVLGILAVNALAYAFPSAVYMNPSLSAFPVTGDAATLQWAVDTFFHSKFITLFSMLFGASIFLVGGERNDPVRRPLIRRRLTWLIVFALAHGLVLWWGDVLLLYAVSGLIVMLFRSMSGRRLIWIGLSVTVVLALLQAGGTLALNFAPAEVQASVAAQKASMGSPEIVAASIQAYQSGWAGAFSENLKAWVMLQTASVFFFSIPTAALMLVGMGLLKTGFLAGRAPVIVYLLLVLAGGVMLAATGWYGWLKMAAGDGPDPTHGLATALKSGAFIITLGYMSLLILMVTRGLGLLVGFLAPVGRMAFTNYLAQSLIMTTLFTQPWGPQLIGQVDRPMLALIVVGVWAAQLIWSPLWLARFQMGPLEWLWRCLTYKRPMPISRPA